MFRLILKRSIEEYQANLKVIISFGMLLAFLFLFVFFEQFFLASGTAFLSFNFSILSIIGIVLGLIFLYIFSFFITLTVYSVKRDVQRMDFDTYWNFLMKKASAKIFIFYLILAIVLYIISSIGLAFGVVALTMVISFVVTMLLMYVPQSIVLDEAKIFPGIIKSIEFWLANPLTSILILIVGSILIFISIVIEFVLELFGLPGVGISFIILLIGIVPFLEQMKSYAFILKYSLIRETEVMHSKVKTRKAVKIDAVRLREKVKGGKI
ncbi:MAG: hypothetical protein HON47_04335 [Candidatus Diapherotrites archaeon]|jgi:hypothetical protein|uniref:Uncharacterized protein n=1 Tax=Candidatus Iainarchaeum sp. TaxID=3101447 RepID=A0A8T5GGD3_9ARCH|nr:hypothetical protein [Candidatus Diapherotrites archaeon]MBT7240998.1 hypothetical protein [Candidatus Diapherotrites archaeon]